MKAAVEMTEATTTLTTVVASTATTIAVTSTLATTTNDLDTRFERSAPVLPILLPLNRDDESTDDDDDEPRYRLTDLGCRLVIARGIRS